MELTDEEKQRLDAMDDDELHEVVTTAVLVRKKTIADRRAYASACNDLIKMQEATMEYAAEQLKERATPTNVGASTGGPPPLPPH